MVASVNPGAAGVRSLTRDLQPVIDQMAEVVRPPQRRALLVGINEFAGNIPKLEGCVNDVFEMSATLQEIGFKPDEIRVILDDRATASNLLERLNWLLEDASDGDERVFFYSGHGAQIPVYNVLGEPDSNLECLVPHDFAWTPETMITDQQLVELYSQLPYGVNFMMVLDCCHAGGIWRDGASRVRGINPPDDIRHRMLAWDRETKTWVKRELTNINADSGKWVNPAGFVGSDQSTRRLGRSTDFRELENKSFDRIKKEKDHHGPYLPVIIEACQEGELAQEYRHGVTSYGAFTFNLTRAILSRRAGDPKPTFESLVNAVTERIKKLGYDQNPSIIGPAAILKAEIPFGDDVVATVGSSQAPITEAASTAVQAEAPVKKAKPRAKKAKK